MFLNSIPFFRLTLSLTAGIAAGLYFDHVISPWIWVLAIATTATASLWLMSKRQLQPVGAALLYLSQMLLGYVLTQQTFLSRHDRFFLKNGTADAQFLTLRIEEPLTEKKNTWRAAATVLSSIGKGGEQQKACGRLLVYWPRSSNPVAPELRYGDVILVPALTVEMPGAAFPEGFDFKAVMRYRNTGHQLFLTKGSFEKSGHDAWVIKQWAYDMRESVVRRLHHIFPAPKAALLASLLIGYKDEVEQDDLKSFAATGAMHVLAVSGMHAGLIYVALLFVFTGSVKSRKLKIWQGFLIISLLWLYAMITGLSASVVRAALMFTLLELGRSFLERDGKMFNTLFAAAYLQLLISPLNLIDVGFQLSYLAVFGILYFYPAMNRWYQPPTRALSLLWQMGLVSVAATLGTLPVSLFFFKSFPLWFIPVNMLVVPLSSLIIYLGMCCLVFSYVPLLGTALIWLTSQGLDIMMWPMRFFASLPGASISGFSFDLGDAWLLGAAVLMLGAAVNARQGKHYRTAFAGFMLLFSLKQMWDFEKSGQGREMIVCEMKGQFIAAFREGRSLYFLSQPLSRPKADSLLYFTTDYRQKYHINRMVWLMADSGTRQAGSFRLQGNNRFTRVLAGHHDLGSIAWLPDSLEIRKDKAPVYVRYRYRKYAGNAKNVILIRNNYRRNSVED